MRGARAGLRLLLLFAGALAPATARAHPHEGPAYDSLLAHLRAQPPRAIGLPDPARASWLAAGATLAPLAAFAIARDRPTGVLAAAALVAGPVAGFAHAGLAREAVPAAAVRGLLVGAAVAGTAPWWSDNDGAASPVGMGCAAITVGSALWDVLRLGARVERSNEDAILLRLSGMRMIVTPTQVELALRF